MTIPFVTRAAEARGGATAATAQQLGEFVARIVPLGVVLVVTGVLRGDGFAWWPAYDIDEGTILSQAWAFMHLGKLDPYTYWYDHPPLGWIVLAPLTSALGAIVGFTSALVRARAVMLVVALVSMALTFVLIERLTGRRWIAWVVTLVLALSPLAIEYQRMLKLDNLATPWLLASLVLSARPSQTLLGVAASALLAAIAVLTKEPMLFFVPGVIYLLAWRIEPGRRSVAVLVWLSLFLLTVSLYPMFALLRGELFPSGSFLGGSAAHVSLIGSLLQRSADYGDRSLGLAAGDFWTFDPMLLSIGGIAFVGALGAAIAGPSRQLARLALVLGLPYAVLMARAGVVREYWVLPLLPVLGLLMAATLSAISDAWNRVFRGARGHMRSSLGGSITLAGLVLVSSGAPAQGYLARYAAMRQTDSARAYNESTEWAKANLPAGSVVVVDSPLWVDLRESGAPQAPRSYFYWAVDRDPQVRQALANDWRSVEYIVVTPVMDRDIRTGALPFIDAVERHSIPIATFESGEYWVRIERVIPGGPIHSRGTVFGR